MSSENYVRIIMAENLRFLGEGSSALGKPEAKARPEGVVDGEQVENPVPRIYDREKRGHRRISGSGSRESRTKEGR